MTKTQLFIIGGGPAGLTAAIYAARAGLHTTVCYADGGALEKASHIENYFGFSEPISGAQLLENGRAQARHFGAQLLSEQAVDISMTVNAGFLISTPSGEFMSDVVLLATGQERKKLTLSGADTFEGHGVSFCAICDGFFYRDKHVAVVGNGKYALSEATELKTFTQDVTIFTDGDEPEADFSGFTVVTDKLSRLDGADDDAERLGFIVSDSGLRYAADGLFVALGKASSSAFARKLGVPIERGTIMADPAGKTMIPGFYVAGDCRGGLLQICKASADGARAAISAVAYIRTLRPKSAESKI